MVAQSKKTRKNASIIFLKRKYSAHKCASESTRITLALVTLLSRFLQECYYLKHWLKLVKTSLEKGKGHVIRKLRSIVLIEVDL